VLLVIAPHPDDETLCCAGAIQQVLAGGGAVSIVWLTSGDGSALAALFAGDNPLAGAAMRRLGELRMAEARRAARSLGVPAERQYFLGYPDGALRELLREPQSLRRSHWTHAEAVPYAGALFPGHPYRGEALRRDLAAVLQAVHPTLLLAPSLEDTHPDHAAAGRLALEALAAGAAPALRWWIVHGGEGWPAPRTLLPGLPLQRPPVAAQLPWQALELNPDEESRKLTALEAHASQMGVMAPFLLAFVRSTELYATPAEGRTVCVRCASSSAGVLQPERTPQVKNTTPQAPTTSRSQPQGR